MKQPVYLLDGNCFIKIRNQILDGASASQPYTDNSIQDVITVQYIHANKHKIELPGPMWAVFQDATGKSLAMLSMNMSYSTRHTM